jgi:hypothetical protein
MTLNAGTNFIEHVADRLELDCIGNNNTYIGLNVGKFHTASGMNVFVGDAVGDAVTSAQRNTASGYAAFSGNVSGVDNTTSGYVAQMRITGFRNTSFGSKTLLAGVGINYSIALGYAAGIDETTSNKLFIHAFDEVNEAGGRANSLIYGIMAQTNPANQHLYTNSNRHIPDHIPDDLYDYYGSGDDCSIRWDNANAKMTLNAGTNFIEHIADRLELDHQGTNNIFIGLNVGRFHTTSKENVFVGDAVGDAITSGQRNTASGYAALSANVGGFDNTTAGYASQMAITAGRNTSVGSMTLLTGVGINNSIALGYAAGIDETASNKLFIHAFDEVNEAGGRANSLIYGIMAQTNPANQELHVNANLYTPDDLHHYFGDPAAPDASIKWDNANAKMTLDAGSNFIEHVADRLELDHRGTDNIFIGKDAGKDCGAAIRNVGIGDYVFDAGATFTGDDNTVVGYGAGGKITGGQHNTLTGTYAGGNITDGLDNIFCGYKAGHYGNPSNTFYLDNRDRANEAGQQANSLIHGLFGANAAAQDIYFNANMHLAHDNLKFYLGAGADSKIYFNGSKLVLETGDVTNTDDILLTTAAQGQVLLAQSGSAGTPSLAFNSSVALGLYRYNNTTLGVSQNLRVLEDLTVEGDLILAPKGVTISGGSFSKSAAYMIVSPEGGIADNLDNINGGISGDLIILQGFGMAGANITIRHEAGNISLDGSANKVLVDDKDVIQLLYNGANWCQAAPMCSN